MKKLPLGLTGGLAVSFLGLLTFFGAYLYQIQRGYIKYGYPETWDEWAYYVGVCLFLLGALVFVLVVPLRAGTRRLIIGPAVSFLGLLTLFGAGLYDMQWGYIKYGYPETGYEWAGYVGNYLFLLGVLVFVIVAPLRAGTSRLIIGPAISFLGLLTFFGAVFYTYQLVINEYGYRQLTTQGWALYVGLCVFFFSGLILMVNVLSQLGQQIDKDKQATSTGPPS
jgi:ATP/ADP translocase